MNDTSVRESRRADELQPGHWLAADQFTDDGGQPVEILGSFPYSDADGDAVLLVYRPLGGVPRTSPTDAHVTYDVATQDEIDEGRTAAARAQFVEGLREFADWVEANPWAPIGWDDCGTQEARVQVNLHGADEAANAANVDQVRKTAARLEVSVEELDDRTKGSTKIGSVSYSVIAWHKALRPAERQVAK